MKKEILGLDGVEFPVYSLNTIIIGSGAAGLNTAIQLWEKGQKNIAVVTEIQRLAVSRQILEFAPFLSFLDP